MNHSALFILKQCGIKAVKANDKLSVKKIKWIQATDWSAFVLWTVWWREREKKEQSDDWELYNNFEPLKYSS